MTPDPRQQPDDLGVPEDDAVIGRAFRWSLVVIAVIVAAISVGVWIAGRSDEPPPTDEGEIAGPGQVVAAEDAPVVTFTDITQQAGIDFEHRSGAFGAKLLPETMGGGAAFLDFDGDGDQDLLFAAGRLPSGTGVSAPEAAVLYRNDGQGNFERAGHSIGLGSRPENNEWTLGIAAGDYDADGDVDVFLTGVQQNRLFRNDGGRFTEVAKEAGVVGNGSWTTSAGFHDLDQDGDLDLFVCSYVKWSPEIDKQQNYTLAGVGRAYGPPNNFEGAQCFLYRNRGDGTFADVSQEAGIHVVNKATGDPVGKSLGVRFFDPDGDGNVDVFVANDTVRNFLFRNKGDGNFEEVGELAGVAYDSRGAATGAMGVDVADVRSDGAVGVAVGNFASEMSSLYLSRAGRMQFTDAAISEGVGAPSRQALSFGLFFFDYDLDGRPDLFQTNGHLEEDINKVQPSQHYEQPSQLFWNAGGQARAVFALVDPATVGDLARPVVGRGCAYADIDGDGDLDVVVTQVGRAPLLLRNDQALGHHWLRVRLDPKSGSPIGARVRVELPDGRVLERAVEPTRSYLSQVESVLTFGLGTASSVRSLEVIWADGTRYTQRELRGVDTEVIVGTR